MAPSFDERDQLFRSFARALFGRDMDALYEIATTDFVWSYHDGLLVTKSLIGPAAILAHLNEQKDMYSAQRFSDVIYCHCPDTSFMTCRIAETVRATGEKREQRGVEVYGFRDGKITHKDVYRKPIA